MCVVALMKALIPFSVWHSDWCLGVPCIEMLSHSSDIRMCLKVDDTVLYLATACFNPLYSYGGSYCEREMAAIASLR